METSDLWNSALHASPHREETPRGQGWLLLRFWASPPSTLRAAAHRGCPCHSQSFSVAQVASTCFKCGSSPGSRIPAPFVFSLSPLSFLVPLIWSWPTVPSPFSPQIPLHLCIPHWHWYFTGLWTKPAPGFKDQLQVHFYYATPSPYKEKWPWQISLGPNDKKKKKKKTFLGREVGCSIFPVLWTRVPLVSRHQQNLCFEGWISSRPPGHTVVLSQSLGQSLLCVCVCVLEPRLMTGLRSIKD